MKKIPVPSTTRSSSPSPGNCNGSWPPAVPPLLIRPSLSLFLALLHYSVFLLSRLRPHHRLRFQFLFLLLSSLLMQLSHYSCLMTTFWSGLPSSLVHLCSVLTSVSLYPYYSFILLLILGFLISALRLDDIPVPLPSLPDISVMPGSPVPLSSPVVPVSPLPVPHVKVEVLEPLDQPPPRSRRLCRIKTPYVVPLLSPSPPLVVSPVVRHAPTISISPRDTPIPVPPTLRKRARRKPSPPPKKRCPANTSMLSYYFLLFLIIDLFLIAQNFQSLYGLCSGHPFLNLVLALFVFPTREEIVRPLFFLYLLSFY